MLLKTLPQDGWPNLTGLPFDLMLDGWSTRSTYTTARLPDGTLPLFLKPRRNNVFSDYDLGLEYFSLLRPDTFSFAWRTGGCSFYERYDRKGVFTSGILLTPRPTWYQFGDISKHIERTYGATIEVLAEFDKDLLALAEQWLARERRRQAAGLLYPWTFEHVRLQNPLNQSDYAVWKCSWHPRTNGEDIAREYPPDWIGGEPEDHYNNYRGFQRVNTELWVGPNGEKVRQTYRNGWKIDNVVIPETKLITEAIDAYVRQVKTKQPDH